jgi:hypothetical protein
VDFWQRTELGKKWVKRESRNAEAKNTQKEIRGADDLYNAHAR